MGLLAIILVFIAASGFWTWIVFLDGAERLEGSFISAFLVYYRAPEWTAEGIRVFAVLCWLGSLVWVILRLCFPSSQAW